LNSLRVPVGKCCIQWAFVPTWKLCPLRALWVPVAFVPNWKLDQSLEFFLLEEASIYKRAFPYRSCHKLIFAFFYYCFKSTFVELCPRRYRGSTSFRVSFTSSMRIINDPISCYLLPKPARVREP
jgi:hypothetical protein